MARHSNYQTVKPQNLNLTVSFLVVLISCSIPWVHGAAVFKNSTSGALYEIPTISPTTTKEPTAFELVRPTATTPTATSTTKSTVNLTERAGDDSADFGENEEPPKNLNKNKESGRNYGGGGYFIAAPPPRFSRPPSTSSHNMPYERPIRGRHYKNQAAPESNNVYGGDHHDDGDDDEDDRHHDNDEDDNRNPWNSVDLWQPHEERKKNGEFPQRPIVQDPLIGSAGAAAEEKEDEDDEDNGPGGNGWLQEMGLEARGRRMLNRVMQGVNTVCSTLFPFVEAMGSERFCVKAPADGDDDDV